MLIDFSELVELVGRVGETKVQILQSCITPKHWSDLVGITKKAEPTLLVHVNDLIKMRLLEKNDENRTYSTTDKGLEFLKLEPYVRPSSQKGIPLEIIKMVQRGIRLGQLTFKEEVLFSLLGVTGIEHDKNLKPIYENVAHAMRDAITLWLPQGLEPDKVMYREVNRLIGLYTKKRQDYHDGKVTIIIEFDLPTALDRIIREEKNDEIRNRLENDREQILKKIYKNWHRMFPTI